MHGLMQQHPLLISALIEHASREHPHAQIVSRMGNGDYHRCSYVDVHRRARQLAKALHALGIEDGQRVGSFAWNSYRHLELFFGVSGMGAVLHTINPRLFPEQIAYIINHAEDQLIFFDPGCVPLLEQLAPGLLTVRHFVALTDREQMPTSRIPNLICYEELIASRDDDYAWPSLDENSASSLCYTSGTTGNPKGVLYSHRSTLLHAMTACMRDGMGVGASDILYVAAPMFHVNAWGTPYASALAGASMVLPGTALNGANIYNAMRDEAVTIALGVPTVWMGLHQYVAEQSLDPREDLCLARVFVGGAAMPQSLVRTFAEEFNAQTIHAWGMTETSPLATICAPLHKHTRASADQRIRLQARQGRAVFGVGMKLVDDAGNPVARDGQSPGHLLVRGYWITSGYFRGEGGDVIDGDDWFDTGDIATIDADGYMQITDRAKDLIKSGGEWISSIALENAAVGHPKVTEAAVIAIAHEKWQERPLLIVVKQSDQDLSKSELLEFLSEKVAKWWLPDDVVFVDELPHTATGKLQKMKLREQFSGYKFGTA